jgi:hypothetical protein
MRIILAILLMLSVCLWSSQLLAAQYDFAKEGEDLNVPGETVQQATDEAAAAMQQTPVNLTVSAVGLGIGSGSEAEKYLQETAQIGNGGYFTVSDTGQLSAAMGAAALGQTSMATTTPTDTVVLTQPKDGDTIGPNMDIVGKTTPGELVVVVVNVFNNDTGEKLRVVPGFRGRAKETGEINFRVATPRVSFGANQGAPPLRYELHAGIVKADGTKGPETIVNVFSPK